MKTTGLILTVLAGLTLQAYAAGPQKIRIVIDAAHGGKDAGAVSAGGDKESDITLQLAKALEAEAKAQHIEMVQTRTSADASLTLEERAKQGSEAGVKTVLISLHANYSASNADQKGVEVYYYKDNASGNQSQWLAEKLKTLLTSVASVKMAEKNLVVLRNAQVPAVTIEAGYLSNAEDLANLKNKDYQKKIASLIVKAVQD